MKVMFDRTWSEACCRCFFNAVVWKWWNTSIEHWNGWGVCTCRHSHALVSRVLEMRVEKWVRFYLGCCDEPPIYRGGEWRAAVMAHMSPAVTKLREV